MLIWSITITHLHEMGTCYSSPVAIPLGLNISNCDPGFYCPLINASDQFTWPQICAPSIDCQVKRLGSSYCDAQGVYEPILCPPGFYCPNQSAMLPCPAGTYCIRGSTAPVDCPLLSKCPPQTELRVFYGALIALLIVDLLLLAAYLYRRYVYEPARALRMTREAKFRFGQLSEDGSGSVGGGGGGDGALLSSQEDGSSAAMYTDLTSAAPEPSGMPPPYGGPSTSAKSQLTEAFRRCNAGLTLDLKFRALGLTLPPPVSKCILSGVSGEIRPGRVTGLLGPSGAGKTTFLHVLMGKVRRSKGLLAINGARDEMQRYRSVIGFVPQEDVMLRELTVRENILFSARMRLPSQGWTDADIQSHVDAVIEVLGLTDCAHTLIGDETSRGVSGGQRKRCNVGMELAVCPAALFLDEPTSGLDSSAALEVCRTLRAVADLGLLVVAVIHQPRREIFEQIDDLLLLAPGGVTAYMGPREGAQPYFEQQLGFSFASGSNPADELLDFVAGKGKGTSALAPSPSGLRLSEASQQYAFTDPSGASSTTSVRSKSPTSNLPPVSQFFESQWRARCEQAAKAHGNNTTSTSVDDSLDSGTNNLPGQLDIDDHYNNNDSDSDDSSSEGGYELALMDSQLDALSPSRRGGGGSGGKDEFLLGKGGSLMVGRLQLPGSLSVKGMRRAWRRGMKRVRVALQGLVASATPAGTKDNSGSIGGSSSSSELAFGRGAPFWRQLLLCHNRSLLQQYRAGFTFALEMGVASTAGGIMGGAAAQLPELYNGILKPPYTLISPAPLETIVPSVGLYISLAIGLAGSPAGVLAFGEEKPVFWREAAAGHSRLAYYLAKSVSVGYRLTLGALHFAAVFHFMCSPATSFTVMFAVVWVEFFCVYGLAACVSMLVKREQAPLLAVIASVVCGALCGFGPSLAQARRNGFGWVLDLSYARWASEAFFTSETGPYRRLFMVEEVSAPLFGYTLDRMGTDFGLCILVGLVLRALAFLLLISVNRHKQK